MRPRIRTCRCGNLTRKIPARFELMISDKRPALPRPSMNG